MPLTCTFNTEMSEKPWSSFDIHNSTSKTNKEYRKMLELRAIRKRVQRLEKRAVRRMKFDGSSILEKIKSLSNDEREKIFSSKYRKNFLYANSRNYEETTHFTSPVTSGETIGDSNLCNKNLRSNSTMINLTKTYNSILSKFVNITNADGNSIISPTQSMKNNLDSKDQSKLKIIENIDIRNVRANLKKRQNTEKNPQLSKIKGTDKGVAKLAKVTKKQQISLNNKETTTETKKVRQQSKAMTYKDLENMLYSYNETATDLRNNEIEGGTTNINLLRNDNNEQDKKELSSRQIFRPKNKKPTRTKSNIKRMNKKTAISKGGSSLSCNSVTVDLAELENYSETSMIELFKRESNEFQLINDETLELTQSSEDEDDEINEKNDVNEINDDIFPDNFKEIMKADFQSNPSSSSSEYNFWAKDTEIKRTIGPLEQVSFQCKKMVEELVINEPKIIKSYNSFDSTPIDSGTTVSTTKNQRPNTPVHDKELKAITVKVFRKKGISDIHELLENQIKQADSYDFFLKLMDQKRRKIVLERAEEEKKHYKNILKNYFRKKYKFRVGSKYHFNKPLVEKKEQETKFMNSLWFTSDDSVMDNKKSSKKRHAINEKSMGDHKKIEKSSNYSTSVKSDEVQVQQLIPASAVCLTNTLTQSTTLKTEGLPHFDILDELTLNDLIPFKSEYPRRDYLTSEEIMSHHNETLYKITRENHDYLQNCSTECLPPKSIRNKQQKITKNCKKKLVQNSKMNKKNTIKGNSLQSKTQNIQMISTKAATQLLMSNITGGIKQSKNSARGRNTDKIQKQKEKKPKQNASRKNSIKIIIQDSKQPLIQQRTEQKLSKIFTGPNNIRSNLTHKKSMSVKTDFPQKPVISNKKIHNTQSKLSGKKSNIRKLFPYINDPENLVFQNITILPVEVSYMNNTLEEAMKRMKEIKLRLASENASRNSWPIPIPSLSEIEKSKNEKISRPSTGGNIRLINWKKINQKFGNRGIDGNNSFKQETTKFSPNPSRNSRGIPVKYCEVSYVPDNLQKKTHQCKPIKTNYVGKTIERNESRKSINQLTFLKPTTQKPWKPASRHPKIPPVSRSSIKHKNKDFNIIRPFTSKQFIDNVENVPRSMQGYQSHQKCKKNNSGQIILNPDCKIIFENKNPNRNENKQPLKAPHAHRPNTPTQQMVEDIYNLRNKNVNLQESIQNAINIIEKKMVKVLSTNDYDTTKRTIDRMEEEIKRVLKMINRHNCEPKKIISETNTKIDENPKDSKITPLNVAQEDSTNNIEQTIQSDERSLCKSKTFTKPLKVRKKRYISKISNIQVETSPPTAVEVLKNDDISLETEETTKEENHTKLEGSNRPHTIEDNGNFSTPNTSKKFTIPENQKSQKLNNLLFSDRDLKRKFNRMSREAFGRFADIVRTKTNLIINMTERINIEPQFTSVIPIIPELQSSTLTNSVDSNTSRNVSEENTIDTENETILTLSEDITRRDSYTWPELGRFNISTTNKISKNNNYLTPFMKALSNIRSDGLINNRRQLIVLREFSPSFTKLMDFLEGLTTFREIQNRRTLRDMQLMWNPEKRCSFHSSIKSSRKINFVGDIKAASEPFMITRSEVDKENDDITDENENILTVKGKALKLVTSDTVIISIPGKKGETTFEKKTSSKDIIIPNNNYTVIEKDNKYAALLEIFYVLFYSFIYLCVNAVNFSCP